MTILVDALAVFRLSRLVTRDRITEPLRTRAEHGPEWLAYLLRCAWCSSPYLAVGVIAARRIFPRPWAPVAEVLACSAVAGLLTDLLDG